MGWYKQRHRLCAAKRYTSCSPPAPPGQRCSVSSRWYRPEASCSERSRRTCLGFEVRVRVSYSYPRTLTRLAARSARDARHRSVPHRAEPERTAARHCSPHSRPSASYPPACAARRAMLCSTCHAFHGPTHHGSTPHGSTCYDATYLRWLTYCPPACTARAAWAGAPTSPLYLPYGSPISPRYLPSCRYSTCGVGSARRAVSSRVENSPPPVRSGRARPQPTSGTCAAG